MSSNVVSALQLLQMNNYATVILLTAVVYDYILTFTSEINYVWRRPWSWVSTTFVIARYLGIYWIVAIGLSGSTFVPGPVETYGTAIFLTSDVAFSVFYAAAELVMIWRVYAIWNRSKAILATLSFVYVVEVISNFVVVGIYDNPDTYFSATVVRIDNVGFCNYSIETAIRYRVYYAIPRYVLGTALLVLALVKSLSESIVLYKATKRWQPNRYMNLFMKDGILYFSLNLLFNVFGEVQNNASIDSAAAVFLAALTDLLLCPIVPRFIINAREMYDDEVHSEFRGVDTGFGMAQPSAIEFVDVIPEEGQVAEPETIWPGVIEANSMQA